jgi:hypothetical protein
MVTESGNKVQAEHKTTQWTLWMREVSSQLGYIAERDPPYSRLVFLCLCVANPSLVALTASEGREIITKRIRLATVSCQDHCTYRFTGLPTSKVKRFVGVVLEARLFTPVLKQQHSMNGPDIRALFLWSLSSKGALRA